MISIVIPTLNEAAYLRKTILHTLSKAKHPEQLEIIVVDAGSDDETISSVIDLGINVHCMPDFALKKHKSLNYGLEKSTAEVVMFLDADTLLPNHFDEHINKRMEASNVVGGAFEFAFEKPDWKLQLITLVNRIRYRFGKVFYGDQAVFARRQSLNAIGGIPNEPLMETAFLCKKLRKEGRLVIVKSPLKTSPRRFLTHGFFKVAWFDINMFIRFNLGLPVSDYAMAYWSKNLRVNK
ncbi:glycosyltransferase [Ekhidna sp.]|uniref:glycosyltransferase n=1 Tax=Ekhidna sp. TaxID=2608089 RepID=UPI003CCBA376